MIDIVFQSLFINYLGITMLMASTHRKMPITRAVVAGISVTVATTLTSLIGFYSMEFYPRPLRFFVLPAIAILASLVTVRIAKFKKGESDIVIYNTAVCGVLVLSGQRLNSTLSALAVGSATGAGFMLALLSVYVLRFMCEEKNERNTMGTAAEILFFAGLVSLLISGVI